MQAQVVQAPHWTQRTLVSLLRGLGPAEVAAADALATAAAATAVSSPPRTRGRRALLRSHRRFDRLKRKQAHAFEPQWRSIDEKCCGRVLKAVRRAVRLCPVPALEWRRRRLRRSGRCSTNNWSRMRAQTCAPLSIGGGRALRPRPAPPRPAPPCVVRHSFCNRKHWPCAHPACACACACNLQALRAGVVQGTSWSCRRCLSDGRASR